MKIDRIIQVSLIAVIGAFALFAPDLNDSDLEAATIVYRRSYGYTGGPYYRRHYYPHYYHPYIRPYYRTYVYPRVVYKVAPSTVNVSITIKNPRSSKEYIQDLYLDGDDIPLPSPDSSGYIGAFNYKLSPGTHTIEWSIKKGWFKTKNYRRNFNVDPKNNNVNIVIDGDSFTQQ